MRLENLQLLNFKNYEEVHLRFSPRINVLVGKNGSGKTNLLDAIYYLSATKSAFSKADQQCIHYTQRAFMVKGDFHIGASRQEVSSAVQSGAKKVFRVDGADYQKLAEHIGRFPAILMAPDDVELVREGGEARRRFFDNMISQLDPQYLDNLIQYNHVLKQRNSLLRMYAERGSADWIAVDAYDQLLQKFGSKIHEKRKEFVSEFQPYFDKFYKFIVGDSEVTALEYVSELSGKDFMEGLFHSRSRDQILQRTTFGIHRDDYIFTLEGGEMKLFGSQGQQKSFVIAMKLAQFEILRKHNGFKPILLLDDIFDKLDDNRIGRLLELMRTDLGQLFITDARPDRTRGLLDQIHAEAYFFTIENGKVKTYEPS